MTTGAVVAPPALFVLLVIRGKNPFHATMIGPLSATILGGVALYFGIPAVRAYGLLVQPTRMVSLRFLAIRDLMFGFVFSTVGALAVFLMWRKPEEKLFYSAYVLFGLIVFSLHHAFRRKG